MKPLAAVAVALALALTAGCGFRDIKEQIEVADSIGQISGRIDLRSGRQGAVHVLTAVPGNAPAEFAVTNDVLADSDGSFRIPVTPGTYFVGAYQDTSGDQLLQRDNEPADYYRDADGRPRPLVVAAAGRVALPPLVVSGPAKGVAELSTIDDTPAFRRNIGRVVGLDDPMFSDENASMGLWRPVDFLADVGGGLFMLQEFQPGRTPVIFVHGIGGSPAIFGPAIATLDRGRFQPWVLYYPSGLRLDMVSDYLDRALLSLQDRYRFNSVYVVAHSMGGLVARSFVMKHSRRGNMDVGLLMTINSPMHGMASAAQGVEHSPLVVPSWRDVAEGSEFIAGLDAWRLPPAIPYHLVFAFEPGKGSDGVATLESQIPPALQAQATRLYGFSGSHTGLLADAKFLQQFRAIMDASGAPRPAR